MPAIANYRKHLEEIALLSSAHALLEWDQETHIPDKGIQARSRVIGRISRRVFELTTSPDLGNLLEELRTDGALSQAERASVREVGRQYRRRKAIPADEFEAFTTTCSQAQAAWAKAREASDFQAFLPHLEKVVDHQRRFADYYGYTEHPYDALLEDYEPGMTLAQLEGIMQPLRDRLAPFIGRLADEGTPPDPSPLQGDFRLDKQRALARAALEFIQYDFECGALDDVEHPFTIAIAYGDVRVTNAYKQDRLGYGLFGALHEGGHGLYHQGMPEELFTLRLEEGSSAGIDEAQALIIENQLGRGLPFWKAFYPTAVQHFPELAAHSPEELYRATNLAEPSMIRIEADEVTYNLHIMLRTELESGLIAGDIRPAELPRLWNEAMERYLGIVPQSDAEGVLQDVHWSFGYYGYFPSYMLGSLYAAQFHQAMLDTVPDLDASLATGDFAPMLDWLRGNVHQHGAVYLPGELVEQATGSTLDSSYFLDYIEEKFSAIYRMDRN